MSEAICALLPGYAQLNSRCRRHTIPPTPARPEARRRRVEGSGTDVGPWKGPRRKDSQPWLTACSTPDQTARSGFVLREIGAS